ncbi:hypothetical protein NPIL_70371 [Nephila pilipes]|uniref:Uncharacterized protein n=1 Tax=Nephila pilipes TaxID=299642 RepID=A0A8X6U783_NEPPI|nr:hypothetical protein NPIL_70371 [Nephila pilipes]
MGCTDPCHGMEVYKLRDSLGPTIPADRRAHCSVFDITRGQEIVQYLKRGDTEQETRCSFQCIRDETNVLSRKQQNVMNQIKETKMAQEALWKCKVAEGKAERDVLKMERDALKTERDVIKTELDMIKTERDGLLAKIARLKRTLMLIVTNMLM